MQTVLGAEQPRKRWIFSIGIVATEAGRAQSFLASLSDSAPERVTLLVRITVQNTTSDPGGILPQLTRVVLSMLSNQQRTPMRS